VARAISADSQRIDLKTDRSVPFNGGAAVTIPAGAEYVSDPVSMNVPALATLAVTMHFAALPKVQTGHPGSRATSYFAPGDQLSAVELRRPSTVDHWYYLSAIDVEPQSPSAAVAIVGASARARDQGDRRDNHGIWRFWLLSSRCGERSRSQDCQRLDSGTWQSRCRGRFRRPDARSGPAAQAQEGIRFRRRFAPVA